MRHTQQYLFSPSCFPCRVVTFAAPLPRVYQWARLISLCLYGIGKNVNPIILLIIPPAVACLMLKQRIFPRRMGNEPLDSERKIKDDRPFIYTPLAGAGTNEEEEHFQK